MNIVVLETICKWVSCMITGFVSIFGGNVLKSNQIITNNLNQNKSHITVSEVIPYETEIVYNTKKPSTISKVLVEGEIGMKTTTKDEIKIIKNPVTEVIEQGTGKKGEYVGKLTGYGADCQGCSKTGNVACHTKNRGYHSLISDGETYKDDEFGEVRVLSAATAFPCGTIIKVDNKKQEPFYGVVLDRGGSMNKAWANGTVWIDVAYKTVQEARQGNITTGKNVSFEVQRWGF